MPRHETPSYASQEAMVMEIVVVVVEMNTKGNAIS